MSAPGTERVDPFDLPSLDPSPRDEPAALTELRVRIDDVDHDLVALLAERLSLVRTLSKEKESAGWDVYDPVREAAVVRRAAEVAQSLQLDDEAVREIFWRVIRLSRSVQREAAP